MELELYLMECEEAMNIAVEQLRDNLHKVQVGRANPMMLKNVKINYFDTSTLINQIAGISVPEPRQLLIKPFDPSLTSLIAKAIRDAQLGFNPMDEGQQVRIQIPELTTERRRQMVKSLADYRESAKVKIRQGRQEANKLIKKDEELSEDDERYYLEKIQEKTNNYVSRVDDIVLDKEKELMQI